MTAVGAGSPTAFPRRQSLTDVDAPPPLQPPAFSLMSALRVGNNPGTAWALLLALCLAPALYAQETPTERSAASDVVKRMATLQQTLDVPSLVTRLTGANSIRDAIAARARELMETELLAMADDLTKHPEIGFKEERSVKVLTGYLAQTRNCVPSAVSTELVFKDVVAQLTALTVMVDAAAVGPLLEPMDADELKAWLARRLSGAWDPRWAKQKTVRRKPKPLGRVLKGRYGSVDRILRGVHQTVPLRNPPRKRKNG